MRHFTSLIKKIHPTFIQDFFFQITKFCFLQKRCNSWGGKQNILRRTARKCKFQFLQKKKHQTVASYIKIKTLLLENNHFSLFSSLSIVSYYQPQNIYSTKFYSDKVADVVGLCCNHWSVSLTLGVAFIMQLNNDRENLSKQNPSGIYLLSFLKNRSLEENQYTCTKYIVFKEKMSNTANIYVADQPQQT